MYDLGFSLIAMAAIGVVCGVLSILDTFGVIDLDEPECKHKVEDDEDV